MPRNVVFVAPFPIETTMRFARAASKLEDVRLLGVVHTPPEAGSADTRLFHDIVKITEPLSVRDVIDGVEVLKRRHGEPYRIVGILEALMVQMAEARRRHGVVRHGPNDAGNDWPVSCKGVSRDTGPLTMVDRAARPFGIRLFDRTPPRAPHPL